jgi:hypothetical protein
MGAGILPAAAPQPRPPRTRPRIATGDGERYVATIDRVSPSTEHVRRLPSRLPSLDCWPLRPASSIPARDLRDLSKGYRAESELHGNRLPRCGYGATHSGGVRLSEETARGGSAGRTDGKVVGTRPSGTRVARETHRHGRVRATKRDACRNPASRREARGGDPGHHRRSFVRAGRQSVDLTESLLRPWQRRRARG